MLTLSFEKCWSHKLDCATGELGIVESREGDGMRMAVHFSAAAFLRCGQK